MITISKQAFRCPACIVVYCVILLGGATSMASAYEMAPGLDMQRLTEDGKSYTERDMGFAPQGDSIVFYKEVTKSLRELWLIKADGTGAQAISPVGWPKIAGWSPDGSRIGYVFANTNDSESQASVCVYDAATSETTRIAGGYQLRDFGAGWSAPPIWAPDSSHLAYQIHDRQREAWFLWVFPVDGGTPVRLGGNLAGAVAWDTNGSWSPDGDEIVFNALPSEESEEEIYRCKIDGTGLFKITDDRRDCHEPKWSPDGEWIVFFSSKDRLPEEERMGSNWNLLLVRPDGTEEHTIVSGNSQTTEGRATYVHPEWSPDQSFVVCHGGVRDRYDHSYYGTYLVDWQQYTSEPKLILGAALGDRNQNWGHDWAISPDSKKVFRRGSTSVLRGTGREAQGTDYGGLLEVYDVATGEVTKLISYREEKDPYYLYGGEITNDAESWAPDSRRILICQAKVISWEQEQFEPDLYVLTIPGAAEAEEAIPHTEGPPAEEAIPYTETPSAEVSLPAPLSAHLIRPKYLTVEQALAVIPQEYQSHIQAEPERNILMVTGGAEFTEQIREYLAAIDVPAPQVTLDVLATEMSKQASRDLGLDWSYAKGRFGAYLPIGDLGLGQVLYQGVGKLDEEFFVALNALEEKGAATIYANPRLATISGTTAEIKIRRVKYYFYTQGFDIQGNPIIQQSDISADITGKITPRVVGDGHILLDIEVGVGNFIFTSAGTLPDITTRDVKANVAVNEGETIMIGGLVLRQRTRSVSKTPILGDIPLIGNLFRKSHWDTEETVLTIFITPYIGLQREQTAESEEHENLRFPKLGKSIGDIEGETR